MGAFDDLIPKGSRTSLFGDLIPVPEDRDPGYSVAHGPSLSPIGPAIFGDLASSSTMPAEPVPAPNQINRQRMPYALEAPGGLSADQSSAAGDLEAGMLMAGQILPGLDVLRSTMPSADRRDLNVLVAARDLIASGADVSEFTKLREQSTRFPLNTLMNKEAVGRAIGMFEKRAQDTDIRDAMRILEALPEINRRNEQIEAIPVNPAAEKMMATEGGILDAISAATEGLSDDPYGVMRTLTLRSLPASVPSVAGAIGGTAVGGPALGGALAGAGEFATEGGISAAQGIVDALTNSGVDINDRAAVEAFVRANPEVMQGIAADAMQRAATIAATGAVSGGVSGAAARSIARGGNSARRMAGDAVGGLGIDPAMEGVGEALAGGSPADVIAEALGGFGQGAATFGGQTLVEGIKAAMSAPQQPAQGASGDVLAIPPQDASSRPTALPAAPAEPPAGAPVVMDPAAVAPPPTSSEKQTLKGAENVPLKGPPPQDVVGVEIEGNRLDHQARLDETSALNSEGITSSDVEKINLLDERTPEEARIERAAARLPRAPVVNWLANLPSNRAKSSSAAATITGIDPQGAVGRELQAAGVTPQRFPKLFRKGGLDDVDNIVASESPQMAEILRSIPDGQPGAGYFDRQDIIDAVIREAAGEARLTAEQQQLKATADEIARRYDFGVQPTEQASALETPSRRMVPPPDMDIRTDAERVNDIASEVDDYLSSEGWTDAFSPEERSAIIEGLDRRGGSVVDQVDWWLTQEREYGETDRPDQFEPVPFDIAPPAEDHGGGASLAAKAQPDPGAGPASQPGDRPHQPQRTGTAEGGSIDLTPEGEQTVVPGAEQITDKQRAERQQDAPNRGGDAPPPDGGLFSPRGPELFDEREAPARQSSRSQDKTNTNKPRSAEGREDSARSDAGEGSESTGGGDGDPGAAAGTGATTTLKEVAPAKPRTTKPPPGKLAPTFEKFSFTDKNSVYEAAFRAAGMEPDKARLLAPQAQIDELRRVLLRDYGVRIELPQRIVERKTFTGRKVQEKRNRISPRDAIDQMLDAYRQMEMLAAIFGFPKDMIGLPVGGSGLTLSLTNSTPGALGMYSFSPEDAGLTRKIVLPGRSNSFAHEWGHALDHYLSVMLSDGADLFTRKIHEEGADPANEVAQNMVGVLQAMFGERAALAALQISLQVQATEVNKQGNPTVRAKKAMAMLDDIEKGKIVAKEAWSNYFKTAREYEQAIGAGGYFTNPAEMFARAIETHVSVRAAETSDLPSSFLTKPNWAYTGSDDMRAAMTFPREWDQIGVSTAIDRLAGAMRRAGMADGNTATRPEDTDIYDLRKWDRVSPTKGLLAEEKRARIRAERSVKAIERTHPISTRIGDVASFVMNTYGAHAHRIIDRQPKQAQTALRNVVDMFATDPGSGRHVGEVWEEAVQAHTTVALERLANILKEYDLDVASEKDLAALRQMLTGNDVGAGDKITAAAAHIRRLLDAEWRYLTAAGVNVGYAKNGWLPRIVDIDAVSADPGGFKAAAEKVYRDVFKAEVREAKLDDQISDVRRIINLVKGKNVGTETGELASDLRFTKADLDLITSWRKALRNLQSLLKRAEEHAKTGDEDKASALSESLAEAQGAFKGAHGDVLDMLERRYAEVAADNWFGNILTGSPMDFESKGPTQSFTKKRKLPPSADRHMAAFYQGDPIRLINDFLHQSARRAEYVRRVGADGSKIENMLNAAARAGADGRDIRQIRQFVQVLTGRNAQTTNMFVTEAGGWIYTATTAFMLSLATFSSLTESMVAGMRTGRVRDSFRALALHIGQARRSGSAQDRRDLARVIGLTRSAMNETVMMNRYGGDADMNRRQSAILSGFFRMNGLTAITNSQRNAMVAIGSDHIKRMLLIDAGKRDRFFEVGKKRAAEELNDLGIPQDVRADMLAWLEGMEGATPGPSDLLDVDGDYHNDAARIWAPALARFVDTTIQNPRKYTRPGAAQYPGLRLIYGITGFIYSFHREVLGRMLKAGVDGRREGEGRVRAGVRQAAGAAQNAMLLGAPAAMALFAGHALTTLVREALFNPDGWDRAEDEDELEEWLLKRAFSRTGLIGAYDIPYNMVTALRWERDLAANAAGPHIGTLLDTAQSVAALWMGRNSANTNAAENKAAMKLGRLLLEGGGNMLLASIPGGPLTTAGKGAFMYGWNALDPGKKIADGLYPR